MIGSQQTIQSERLETKARPQGPRGRDGLKAALTFLLLGIVLLLPALWYNLTPQRTPQIFDVSSASFYGAIWVPLGAFAVFPLLLSVAYLKTGDKVMRGLLSCLAVAAADFGNPSLFNDQYHNIVRPVWAMGGIWLLVAFVVSFVIAANKD